MPDEGTSPSLSEPLVANKPGRQFPGVGVGAVVIHEARLLMVRRDGAHGAGSWSVPGGWIELWEHPAQAAERETLEETGVFVHASATYGWSDAFHISHEPTVHAITLWIECKYSAGTPRVTEPDKCPEVAWIPLSEVTDRRLFAPFDHWWPPDELILS